MFLLRSLLVLGLAVVTTNAQAVDLGTAGTFAVLGGSTVTNTGPTVLNGDLGISPGTAITGFGPGTVTGTTHDDDGVALQAKNDAQTAYTSLAGRTPFTDLTSQDLGGQTLVAGNYRFTAGAGLTGTLVLDGANNPNSVFVFQIATTLITASNAAVQLINGAQACNVFFQVGTSATIGTDTAFTGTIIASDTITGNTGATFDGGLYALTAAVNLDTNVVDVPVCRAVSVHGLNSAVSTVSTATAAATTSSTLAINADVLVSSAAAASAASASSAASAASATSAASAASATSAASASAAATGAGGSSAASLSASVPASLASASLLGSSNIGSLAATVSGTLLSTASVQSVSGSLAGSSAMTLSGSGSSVMSLSNIASQTTSAISNSLGNSTGFRTTAITRITSAPSSIPTQENGKFNFLQGADELFPGAVDVIWITTVYIDICPTGFVTKTTVYPTTSCTCEADYTPTTCPPGWTTTVAVCTKSVTLTVPSSSASASLWGDSSAMECPADLPTVDCLTDSDASDLVMVYASLLTNFNATIAEEILADNFTEQCDNFNEPYGNTTTLSKQSFIDTLEAQQHPLPNLSILNIWHTCTAITFRAVTHGSALSVQGINVLTVGVSNGSYVIEASYGEFGSAALEVD